MNTIEPTNNQTRVRFCCGGLYSAVLNFFKDSGTALTFSKRFDTAVGTQKVRAFFEGTIDRKELEHTVHGKWIGWVVIKNHKLLIYKTLCRLKSGRSGDSLN